MTKSVTAAEIGRYVNVATAKKIAFVLMMGFTIYHGCIMILNGGDNCKWLLSQGRFHGDNYWQPYGCMLHKYSKIDAQMCLAYISYWGGNNNFVFVGDSRTRQLYGQFLRRFGGPQITKENADHSFEVPASRFKATFFWAPYVNHTMYDLSKQLISQKPAPQLVVIGSGLEMLLENNWTAEVSKNYQRNLTYLMPNLMKLNTNFARVLWLLQDPVDDYKLSARNHTKLNNDVIDQFNSASREILDFSGLKIWSSKRLIAKDAGFFHSLDGLDIHHFALFWDVQILMNLYCNDRIKFADGTCCSEPEPITSIQIMTFIFFGFWILVACVMLAFHWLNYRTNDMYSDQTRSKMLLQTHQRIGSDQTLLPLSRLDSFKDLVFALAKLGFILIYFFVCDRTLFFMKENKAFTLLSFLLPLVYIVVLGCFFTEQSQKTGILHRDMTDEWKGWMQLLILLYHLTGASQVLSIYMHIRLLVSAYLFLSGYSHFTYFWNRNDAGLSLMCSTRCRIVESYWMSRRNCLRRMLEVLFRYNMLVVLLCMAMNRAYEFYYFVPLISVWFVVMVIVMVIWPQVSNQTVENNKTQYIWVLLKIAILIGLVTLLYASESLFDTIFLTNPMKQLFVAHDDYPQDWRFRWQIDRYSVILGMLFAFAYQVAKQNRLLQDNHQKNLFSPYVSYACTFLGIVGMGSYSIFAFFCRDKTECASSHPYLVVFPIVSYVLLRNVLGSVRQKFSTFFASFGRISLEMYIAQYHIWLAADSNGVLVLIPSNQVLNSITTSFIFVCVSHEMQQITAVLLPYAVPEDWRLALRNLFIFLLLVILPIAIFQGVFVF